MFLFLLFLHCHSFSFLPYPSLSSPLLSLFSLFSGRRHKMTHKGWRVVKPQHNQSIDMTLLGWLDRKTSTQQIQICSPHITWQRLIIGNSHITWQRLIILHKVQADLGLCRAFMQSCRNCCTSACYIFRETGFSLRNLFKGTYRINPPIRRGFFQKKSPQKSRPVL